MLMWETSGHFEPQTAKSVTISPLSVRN